MLGIIIRVCEKICILLVCEENWILQEFHYLQSSCSMIVDVRTFYRVTVLRSRMTGAQDLLLAVVA